jgi:small subunit ribosomal protein S16
MSVRIRFRHVGRPHDAFFRLVAIDRRGARDDKPIEILGTFDPHKKKKPEALQVERLKYWLSVGAQPTDTVRQALKNNGLWDQVKPAPLPKS